MVGLHKMPASQTHFDSDNIGTMPRFIPGEINIFWVKPVYGVY